MYTIVFAIGTPPDSRRRACRLVSWQCDVCLFLPCTVQKQKFNKANARQTRTWGMQDDTNKGNSGASEGESCLMTFTYWCLSATSGQRPLLRPGLAPIYVPSPTSSIWLCFQTHRPLRRHEMTGQRHCGPETVSFIYSFTLINDAEPYF